MIRVCKLHWKLLQQLEKEDTLSEVQKALAMLEDSPEIGDPEDDQEVEQEEEDEEEDPDDNP